MVKQNEIRARSTPEHIRLSFSQNRPKQKISASQKNLDQLKTAIWVYFWLLIFEGALRKWVLPGLAAPLLIVRDPIAIYVLYKSYQTMVWKPNTYVFSIWIVTLIAFVTALVVGHGSPVVAIYGARITLIHFPMIFVIGRVLDREDVVKIGFVMLWLTVGMTVLVAIQFFSPQSAFVNRGLAGDTAGSGFSGAAGFFRVPGTFSFTNGLSIFYGLAVAIIAFFWISTEEQRNKRLVLIIATISIFAAVPLSISRTVMFEIAVSVAFLLAAATKTPKLLSQLVTGIIGGFILLLILSNFSFFQTATIAFTERFTGANETEGGLDGVFIDRFLGGMVGAITDTNSSFFGAGLGMGTNAGSQLLTGSAQFLISEGEWGRLIGEMGLILGMVMVVVRADIAVKLLIKGWKKVGQRNYLPWMLMSFGFLPLLQGQWAQPTALGFSILSIGLSLAAMKEKKMGD